MLMTEHVILTNKKSGKFANSRAIWYNSNNYKEVLS